MPYLPMSERIKSSTAMPNFQRNPPRLMARRSEDADAVAQLNISLVMLNHHVRAFEAAMQLYEYSAEATHAANSAYEVDRADKLADNALEILDGWPAIAGRDGAITLFNFSKLLVGLMHTATQVPSLAAGGTRRSLGLAQKRLLELFPNIPGIRHAVGHAGERMATAEKTAEHAKVGPWSNSQITVAPGEHSIAMTLHDVISNRVYSNTWNGEIVSYRLEEASVRGLAEVRDMAFEAFVPRPA